MKQSTSNIGRKLIEETWNSFGIRRYKIPKFSYSIYYKIFVLLFNSITMISLFFFKQSNKPILNFSFYLKSEITIISAYLSLFSFIRKTLDYKNEEGRKKNLYLQHKLKIVLRILIAQVSNKHPLSCSIRVYTYNDRPTFVQNHLANV